MIRAVDSTIPLRTLLPGLDPTEYKLHCAVWNGEEQPLEVFARSRDEWAAWNSWRPGTNAFNRRFIFSMIQIYTEPHRWLYGGIFEVVGRRPNPHTFSYDVELREEVPPGCVGRLKLAFRLPGRTIRLRFENVIDQIEVAGILPLPYAGQPFPGHDSINIPLRQMETVYAQQRADWKNALEHMKGVYVIHDRTSGKPYVGSAYGDTGIWARWGQYVASVHGGNIDLRALVDRDGDERVRDNLVFALLEYWPMRTWDDIVLQRESYWKDVLMSRTFGHNSN
jgi:hypothetical protein